MWISVLAGPHHISVPRSPNVYVLNCAFVVCFYSYVFKSTVATLACSVFPYMCGCLTHTPNKNTCQFSIAMGCSVHITWCTVYHHVMYGGNGQAPTSLHVPHVTCHTGSGWRGLMVQTGHKWGLATLGAFALYWHFSSGNWINISSPSPQITCCIFSVLVNEQ